MNRRLSRLLFLGLVMSAAGAISLVASCEDNTGTGLPPDGGVGGTTGEAGVGTDGSIFEDGGAVQCNNTCSNDLKEIVNCYGEVQDTCMSDKGCYNAACDKNPCEAAELSRSSYGCEYWALKTALLDEAKGACFAAYVANTWSTPVKINVDYAGQVLDVAKFAYVPKGQGSAITYEPYDAANGLGVGEVAILFLARNKTGFVIDCPKPAAITTEDGLAVPGDG